MPAANRGRALVRRDVDVRRGVRVSGGDAEGDGQRVRYGVSGGDGVGL